MKYPDGQWPCQCLKVWSSNPLLKAHTKYKRNDMNDDMILYAKEINFKAIENQFTKCITSGILGNNSVMLDFT